MDVHAPSSGREGDYGMLMRMPRDRATAAVQISIECGQPFLVQHDRVVRSVSGKWRQLKTFTLN